MINVNCNKGESMLVKRHWLCVARFLPIQISYSNTSEYSIRFISDSTKTILNCLCYLTFDINFDINYSSIMLEYGEYLEFNLFIFTQNVIVQ